MEQPKRMLATVSYPMCHCCGSESEYADSPRTTIWGVGFTNGHISLCTNCLLKLRDNINKWYEESINDR